METYLPSSKKSIPFFLIGITIFLLTSCSTYKGTSDNDGIYNSSSRTTEATPNVNENDYYEQYFKTKKLEVSSDDGVFVDIDSYNSNEEEGTYEEEYDSQENYEDWGNNNRNVTVNVYGGLGGFGFNRFGFGYPYYGGFGFNRFGFGGFGYGFGYGGFYNPWFFSSGFYGGFGGFYGGDRPYHYRGLRNTYIAGNFNSGRRSSLANRGRSSYLNNRRSTSRVNRNRGRNSSVRNGGRSIRGANPRRHIQQSPRKFSNNRNRTFTRPSNSRGNRSFSRPSSRGGGRSGSGRSYRGRG